MIQATVTVENSFFFFFFGKGNIRRLIKLQRKHEDRNLNDNKASRYKLQ